MKLQDIAHYYIGCDCLIDYIIPGGKKVVDYKGKFIAYDSIDQSPYCVKGEHETIWTNSIKPVLKRLKDMTRDDMKPIYAHIFHRPFPESGRIMWFDKEERTSAKRFVMMSGVDRVGIEMTGYIWADCDLSHVKFNPHHINHYILTQRFDLFNLIDNGLAVDAKTLKS